MDRINDQQLSSYAKSIVVVTILARCLSHNSQCKVEGIIHPSSEQPLVRHRTLDTILCQEVRVSTTATYSDMESCHLEYIFTKTLAQAAFLVLFTALESVPDDTNAHHDLCRECEKKAFKAAETIHSRRKDCHSWGASGSESLSQCSLSISNFLARYTLSRRLPCLSVPIYCARTRCSIRITLRNSTPSVLVCGTWLRPTT
jgi:hypothetical protein